MQQIHDKKNELFEVEFFTDKECTKLIKDCLPYAENAKISEISNFYIENEKGDITPLRALLCLFHNVNDYFYIPYIPKYQLFNLLNCTGKIKTLDDITPNLSKHIPEDNAVLFLSEEDRIKFVSNDNIFNNSFDLDSFYKVAKLLDNPPKKITIFLQHGTQSELQKAEEVGKYLEKNVGIKPNLCVLHWFIPQKLFIKTLRPSKVDRMYDNEIYGYEMQKICKHINKIITTNSTGILPIQNTERLQVIDSKEIFEEYLKENN